MTGFFFVTNLWRHWCKLFGLARLAKLARLRHTAGMRFTSLILLVATIALGGCAGKSLRPDLVRLYANQTGTTLPPPLIVIHGVLGGRLYDPETEQEVWPGRLRRVVFDDYAHLKMAIDPDTLKPQPSALEVSGS